MKEQAGDEPGPQFVPEPVEVTGVGAGWCSGGFDFDADDSTVASFDEQVDFAAAVGVTEVVHVGAGDAQSALGTQLGGDERVDDPAEKVAVAQDASVVGAQQWCDKAWV